MGPRVSRRVVSEISMASIVLCQQPGREGMGWSLLDQRLVPFEMSGQPGVTP